MLKLIHGADFHLDSPFSGLTPDRAARRRGEQRELLDALAALARKKEADLVLLSGDLLDSEQVFRETAQALARSLGSIPCPVLISPGNHDFYSDRSVYATLDWPENVHIFSSAQMEAVDFPRLNCSVYGRAFVASHQTESPLAGFRAEEDGKLRLACLHGDTTPLSSYGPITPQEMAQSGLHYIALGHIHQYSGLDRAGDTCWAYPGCPEGRGFDELGEKGVLYLEAEPGNISAQFLSLCRRKYAIISVDLTGAEDPLTHLFTVLPSNTSEDIYRILLTGESHALDLSGLELALAPNFYGLTLRDHTRLPQNLWARRDEDTLTGLFLRTLWDKCQSEPDNQTYQLAARFGLAALENGEDAAL